MIADVFSSKKLNPVTTKLFIRRKKQNISLVFITQSYFDAPKYIELNLTHYFVIEFKDSEESLQKMYCKAIFICSNPYYSCTR